MPIILALLFSLLGALSSRADEIVDQALNQQRAAAKAYYSGQLGACAAGEIRCLWYQGDYRMGERMDIKFNERSVWTVRGNYRGVEQVETRSLSNNGIRSLEEILQKMPDSVELTDELEGVLIAWRVGETVEIRCYKRDQLPAAVRRIYDIGGGYIVSANGTDKEILAGRIIIPPLNNIPDGKLPMKLELKNTGKKSVRICTLCMDWRHVSKGSLQVILSPDAWKSTGPREEESAKHVTNLQPGGTVEIPFEVSVNAEKKLRIEASYEATPEFAGKLDLWSGAISAAPVILVF